MVFWDSIFFFQGTVIYTAPEILLGRTPTSKSDVYSVGILMWQLLVRETPFSDIDSSEVLIYKVNFIVNHYFLLFGCIVGGQI